MQADEDDDDADDAGDDEIDFLSIVEAIAAHYETTHGEVVNWGWPLFCVKWARTIRVAAKRRREREAREREREYERLRQHLPG